ncbi:24546_t:CDS:2, partial [Racocetra persica]
EKITELEVKFGDQLREPAELFCRIETFVAPVERDVEEDVEKDVEEDDVEKDVEKDVGKDVEKDVEKDVDEEDVVHEQ